MHTIADVARLLGLSRQRVHILLRNRRIVPIVVVSATGQRHYELAPADVTKLRQGRIER